MPKQSSITCYVPKITPRIEYSFDFIFCKVLGINFELNDDIQSFQKTDSVGLTYDSEHNDERHFSISSIGLLYETHIKTNFEVEVKMIDKLSAFFMVEKGDFPIDLPSFVFYLLSRYEEYEDTELDRHERFQAKNSLAFKNEFLEKPIIDLWIERFAISLSNFYKNLFIPLIHDPNLRGTVEQTFDIDFPWAYKNRTIVSNFAGLMMDLYRRDLKGMKKRMSVMINRAHDPYDQYDFIKDALEDTDIKSSFFMLMRNNSKFDRNHFIHHKNFKNLIQCLNLWTQIGIHPSYFSIVNETLFEEELGCLKMFIEDENSSSRMHFLRLKLPDTYRVLIRHGIVMDYTMGYAECPGFRSGTSYTHRWFDLLKNEKSKLDLVPLIVMDTTLYSYLNLSPEKANKKIKEMMDWVLRMKGNSTILWHNSSLSDWNQWKGWRKVFLSSLDFYKDKRL